MQQAKESSSNGPTVSINRQQTTLRIERYFKSVSHDRLIDLKGSSASIEQTLSWL